jgi:hypothetical protein
MKKKVKNVLLLSLLILVIQITTAQKTVSIFSPDKKIKVECSVEKALYSVSYQNQIVLQNSRLGVVREDEDFSKNLILISVSKPIVIKDNYKILTAKKTNISYLANKQTIFAKTNSGKKINIVFQISNDGIAFRYEFPEQSSEIKKIKSEATTFHFKDSTKAWLQLKTEAQSGWQHSNPSYEAHYMMDVPTGTPSPSKNGWVYPAMFQYKGIWLLITEAALGRTYCGTALQQKSPDNEYSIGFPQDAETIPGGVLNPQSPLPWQTPWRIIVIGNLKTIIESTLGTDLAFPAKKIDSSFIKPGKASWSWIIKKDDSTTFDVSKRYIDYASDMHWQYCLLDANWDTLIGYDSVKVLSDYAKQKNVGLLVWYNSAGNWNTVKYHPKDKLLTHELRIKEFARLEAMGIKGVKIDFFGGDGQSFINYYQDIVEDAATYHLLVNFHGATLPRGWQRTYPNLMTTEAVYGYEMITFNQEDANQEPQHAVMCAMVRNAFDPMDFTPMCLYKIPRINRVTTPAFELATAVLFISGIQHYAESPEGMQHVDEPVKNFLRDVPSVWDDVKFIDGYPGKYDVVARRAGSKWYIAGINGEKKELKLDMDLSFIEKKITGTLYADATDNKMFSVSKYTVDPNKKNAIILKPYGGFVIVIETKN